MKRRAQPWLGTLVAINIDESATASSASSFHETSTSAHLNHAFAQAFAQIATVHRLMSFHASDSDVTRINRAAVGSSIAIDRHTAQVLKLALDLADASASMFNICCAGQLMRWALLPATGTAIPTHSTRESALAIVDDVTVTKLGPALIDLGGIAKGYAVDQAVAALSAAGVGSACVNAGGDLRVLGEVPYPITIRHPQALTQPGAQIEVANAALATSATYFSRRSVDGKSVSALVDGRSGAAITTERSISVIAPSCMVADALTKIVLASGDPQHALLARFDARAFII